MTAAALPSRDRRRVREFMERATRVLGLRLAFHDHLRRSGLPRSWLQHENRACLAVKRKHQARCTAFCGREIERVIPGLPHGSIHTCPFGHTELAVPVRLDGTLAGVLFAGACWTGEGRAPRPGLVRPPSRQWLEDRLAVLRALSRELSLLLAGDAAHSGSTRRERILEFVERNHARAVSIRDLAAELHLSPSRTGHVVRELLGTTFPRLVNRIRLARAARLLSVTDQPAGNIALETGFADQSHFTRAFTRHFGMPPLAYRRRFRMEV